MAGLPVQFDLIGMSDTWGLHKPDPAFFARIAAELRLAPEEIAYVGDRLDNDVRPAAAAGMVAVFVRRGPWAWINAPRGEPRRGVARAWRAWRSCRSAFGRSPFGRTGS